MLITLVMAAMTRSCTEFGIHPSGRRRYPVTPRSTGRRRGRGIVCSAVVVAAGLSVVAAVVYLNGRQPTYQFTDRRVPGGSVVIAGGGAITPDIRKQFIELAGGKQARIVLIPGTDPSPDEAENLLAPWRARGLASVVLLNANSRAQANDAAFCSPLKEATGVWFGGGYQSMLAERYVDTAVQKCLHDVIKRNGVVGGISAGAAILSRVMIREGDTNPVESCGLDIVSNAVIDQHFLARNRMWRLEQMVAAHPNLVGFGVDEATALVIHLQNWELGVVGESYVVTCVPAPESHLERIEILKPGDDVTLAQLREEHLAYHAAAE